MPGVNVGIDQGMLSLTESTNSAGKVSAYVACDKDVDVTVAKGARGEGGIVVGSETTFTIRSGLLTEDVVRRVQIEVPAGGLPEPTTTTTTQPACVDTDGGNVAYYEKGTVRDRHGRVFSDFCYGELLREHYCKTDETAGYKLHTCPYGCVDGRCIPRSETTTTTRPSFTTTTTTTLYQTVTTSSTTSTTRKTCVEGWVCKESYRTYVSQDCKDVTKQYCPLGCLSGECLTETTTTTSSITTTTEKHTLGEIKPCLTSEGEIGQTTWIDGRWSPCTVSCTTGDVRSCVTASGETGTQTCVGGVWKECSKEEIPLWMIILGATVILITILIIVLRQ
ncbi:hypothetical protein DRQ25_00365 [Candidatus Fermentibacteria bacterium]|nr:MAG: hypothetical protein DRQ25_00365 [Candidatus Fermentibacteria bacterium]